MSQDIPLSELPEILDDPTHPLPAEADLAELDWEEYWLKLMILPTGTGFFNFPNTDDFPTALKQHRVFQLAMPQFDLIYSMSHSVIPSNGRHKYAWIQRRYLPGYVAPPNDPPATEPAPDRTPCRSPNCWCDEAEAYRASLK